MTEALYFEARDQPIEGQIAVAETILNRVESKQFPNSICKVVNQYKQFSYTLDPVEEYTKQINNPNVIDRQALELNIQIALQSISGGFRGTHNSLHYYNPDKATPSWAKKFNNSFVIANHRWVY